MRKLAAAVLAVPVLMALYAPVFLRRSIAARVALAIGVGSVLGLAGLGIMAPGQAAAVPASTPAPVASAAFGPALAAGVSPRFGVTVTFTRAMDEASVATALSVEPAAPVSLAWNAAGTALTIAPTQGWAAATLYTVTIGAGAVDGTGHALGAPTRTAFVTRSPTRASIAPTMALTAGVDVRSGFQVTFDHPVNLAKARAAFHVEPAVQGTFAPALTATSGDSLTFVPATPLAADTEYKVSLSGDVLDADGANVALPDAVTVTTIGGPAVVRFRPLDGTTDVSSLAALSVRFTERMNRATTAAAFSATADGKKLTGKIAWAEDDTVLVLTPSKALPAGAKIVMTVSADARSKAGIPLGRPVTSKARVFKAATAGTAGGSTGKPIPHASGGSVGAGSWHAVETYYLKLMNCTRTGGWINSAGTCTSPGGLSTAPIILDAGLSNTVSRPYAKLLATGGACDHFIGGTPTDRLHRAGYSGWAAENIGCRNAANAFASVLGTHIYFQSEKPCSGYCHYANLMNPEYKRCGIGVWVSGGRVRLVIDFLHS